MQGWQWGFSLGVNFLYVDGMSWAEPGGADCTEMVAPFGRNNQDTGII